MNRSSGLFLMTGPFCLTRIGPFYPTLEWPFSPDPNTDHVMNSFIDLEDVLGMSVDGFYITVFKPDTEGYLLNRKFPNNQKGIDAFRSTYVAHEYQGKYGGKGSPLFGTYDLDNFQQSRKLEISIDYPVVHHRDVKVNVLMDLQKVNSPAVFETYNKIVAIFDRQGFHVNNGFFDVYRLYGQRCCYEGLMNYTRFSKRRRDIRERANTHFFSGQLDRMMDVFFTNTIPKHLLSTEQYEMLKAAVGTKNIVSENGHISFTMCDYADPCYRLKRRKIIKEVRDICAEILVK